MIAVDGLMIERGEGFQSSVLVVAVPDLLEDGPVQAGDEELAATRGLRIGDTHPYQENRPA